MIFNSFNFLVVFPLLFLLYYVIPAKMQHMRNLYLLIVSYLLYLNFKPAYGLILLGVTAITFFSAKAISSCRKEKKKLLLVAGVLLTLLPLVVFKYYNFIGDSVSGLLTSIGLRFQLPGLNWAIPVGISFFTFQALSYLWDVYYGRVDVERNFLNYALYVSFFPSIVSGPINKASLVLPQIKALRPYFDYGKAVAGLKQMLWGMFMKVVVADRVALYVDTVFSYYDSYSGLSCLVASLLYSIQIYADFAGYSLMAIGVGKLLGFELTENFRRPYFSFSVTDFWRRWHISLSTWLKDYVYIPLGGSRCSKVRNYLNIIVTFLVSGIWHGANWTYIVWGLWHGIFQVIEKMLNQQKCRYNGVGKAVKIVITFVLVNFAWVFFRMPTIGDAFGVLQRIFDVSAWGSLYLPDKTNVLFILMGVCMLIVKDAMDEFCPDKLEILNSSRRVIRWGAYLAMMIIILMTGVFDAGQFIYASF